jgi:transcriptional regulator with XRE-family HTH domain
MLMNLASSEVAGQAKTSPVANGPVNGEVGLWAMSARKAQTRTFRKLYIGEWLNRLGRRQNEAAEALGVTETYISELISGKKKNPHHAILYDLSEWLGLTINDLYRPPPARAAVEAVDKGMSAADMAALGNLLERVKKAGK